MMRTDDSDRLAVAVLVLGAVTLAGMLLGAWQLVLYPAVVLVGTLLAMSLVRRPRGIAVGVPAGVVVLLLLLYATLHAMGVDSPSGTGSWLGWDPMTALYLFGLGPAFLLVGLLYALIGTDPAGTTHKETAR